jgi:integrase
LVYRGDVLEPMHSRSVALPPALASALEEHLSAFAADDESAPVFAGPKGGLLRRANFAPVWARSRRSVRGDDLHLHDLRQYASTLAASAGASTAELMARLGHASPAAALRYQHATSDRDRVIADRMNELAGGAPAVRAGTALRSWAAPAGIACHTRVTAAPRGSR